MQSFANLKLEDKRKVERKLAELRLSTGQTWDYAILQQPHFNAYPYLEITVSGRTTRPIALEEDTARAAEQICGELDKLFQQQQSAE